MYSDSGFESDTSASSSSSGGYLSGARPALLPRTPWVCDPAFGVVHQEQCTVCRHYMSHFVEGSRASHDPSFHTAVKDRDGRAAMHYREGMEDGRRIQAEKDKATVSRYRDEREESRAKRYRAEEEARRLRVELAEMREVFLAIQMAYEEQISAFTSAPSRLEDDLEALRLMELQSALFDESRVVWESQPNDEPFGIAGPSGWKEDETDFSESDSSIDSVQVEEMGSSSEGSSEESQCSDSEGDSGSLSAAEAKALMDDLSQNPTNPAALVRIRNLFLEAHSTPLHKRTRAHSFVIAEAWKIPTVLGPKKAGSKVPPLTVLPEIFVDASAKGLGFLWNTKWAAWTLNKKWRSRGRDMPWAEMVAVEMGLRTLIAAGVGSTYVRVRSDNQAVVTALSANGIRSKEDALILKEILALCRVHGIVLVPVWVSTKFNPADALSRGRYPSRDLHVDVSPEIPPHLVPFVRDIEARSA